MSDNPQGPGSWLADDATSPAPDPHPSMSETTATAVAPTTATVVPTTAASPVAPTMSNVRPPIPVPEAPIADSPGLIYSAGAPTAGPPALTFPAESTVAIPQPGQQPTWSGELDRRNGNGPAWTGEERRTEVAPMYPDLFQQAVAGSRLAEAVTVNFADGEHRDSLDVSPSPGYADESEFLVSASTSARMPAEVGAFTGASAKKRRWRL
jgi:hypothetical protein